MESRIACICFSCDRPWQLYVCLTSLLNSLCSVHTAACDERPAVAIHVICKSRSDSIRVAYEAAFQRISARAKACSATLHVCWEGDFAEDLRAVLSHAVACPVLLCVDDAVWIRPLPAIEITRILRADVRAIYARMHPGVSYNHPSACMNRLPLCQRLAAPLELMQWDVAACRGSGDWTYAGDISATIFRGDDVLAAVGALSNAELRHPNIFEIALCKALPRVWGSAQIVCCPIQPAAVIATINRTQAVYETRVYDVSDTSPDALRLEFLDRLHSGRCIDADVAAYCAIRRACVHVPEWLLCDSPALQCISGAPLVSVLMPVHNAQDAHIRAALQSIVTQTYAQWELVVVDDGCSPEYAARLTHALSDMCAHAAYANQGVHVLTCEHRGGVAAALNAGIATTRGDFIARMDADDVCMPHRLQVQVSFLLDNLGIDGVGSAVTILHDIDDHAARIALQPQHPWILKWHSLFTCPMIHPSIMLRKRLLLEGGYSTVEEHDAVEDYELWLRLLYPNTDGDARVTLANLGEPLLQLRKHAGSVSATRLEHQMRRSAALCAHAMTRLMRCAASTHDTVPVVAPRLAWILSYGPDAATEPALIADAARLLDACARAFVVDLRASAAVVDSRFPEQGSVLAAAVESYVHHHVQSQLKQFWSLLLQPGDAERADGRAAASAAVMTVISTRMRRAATTSPAATAAASTTAAASVDAVIRAYL